MKDKYKKPRARKAVRQTKATKKLDKEIHHVIDKMAEPKYFQPSTGIQSVYANAASNTGTYWFSLMSGISQNTGDYANRVGDKISLTSLTMNYTIFSPAGAAARPSSCVRVMLIQYLRSDAIPSSGELFRQSDVVSGGGMYSSYSFRNRDYMNFYHVLYDKRHVVNANTTAAVTIPTHYRVDKTVHVKLKKARKTIGYTGGGTNSVNPIYFFAIGDQATTAGADPNVAANFNIIYRDT